MTASTSARSVSSKGASCRRATPTSTGRPSSVRKGAITALAGADPEHVLAAQDHGAAPLSTAPVHSGRLEQARDVLRVDADAADRARAAALAALVEHERELGVEDLAELVGEAPARAPPRWSRR